MALQLCKTALINPSTLQFKPSEIATGAYSLSLDKQMTSKTEPLTALIAKINF
jgi:hypothetical protein